MFIGMSDTTSLHVFLNQEWKWPVLHAPVLESLALKTINKKSLKELQSLLFGKTEELRYPITPLNIQAKRQVLGSGLSAPLVGGNLSLLQSSLATPWQIQTNHRILFIEDVHERAYRVDRMLQQMHQASLFKRVRALILGDFIGAKEPKGKSSLLDSLFQQWAKRVSFPIFKGLPCGHGTLQSPLPLGLKVKISKSKGGKMELIIPIK